MEDRNLLSTFTVANLNDHGTGSLRSAISSASSGDTINFAKGLQGTITLTSGDLPVTNSLSINGPGANKLSVSGNGASRIFDVSGSASVSIAGLTITDGLATSGGAILLEDGAALSLSKCTLTEQRGRRQCGRRRVRWRRRGHLVRSADRHQQHLRRQLGHRHRSQQSHRLPVTSSHLGGAIDLGFSS